MPSRKPSVGAEVPASRSSAELNILNPILLNTYQSSDRLDCIPLRRQFQFAKIAAAPNIECQ